MFLVNETKFGNRFDPEILRMKDEIERNMQSESLRAHIKMITAEI